MHLWKMSKMEVSNNMLLCAFIMLQSIVVMTALLFGVSVFTSRYEKYKAVHNLTGDDGIIIDDEYIMLAGKNEDNLICGEPSEVEALFAGTSAVCTYSIWASYDSGSVWTQYEPRTIGYDSRAAFAYEPELDDGRWLTKKDLETTEIEAVITNNSFGIQVDDVIQITTNSIGEPLEKPLDVHIIGVVSDGTDILGASYYGAERYQDVRDCFFSYSSEFDQIPVLMMLQEDVKNAQLAVFGEQRISHIVKGIQFLRFDTDITDEERENVQACISGFKTSVYNSMDIKQFTTNSKAYIWSQLDEILPVFVGGLVLVIMSAICSSAMMTRGQLRNYALYYLVGLKWSDCIKIQAFQQILMQGGAFLIVMTGLIITSAADIFGDTVLEAGIEQILACIVYIAICILASIILPIRIIHSNSPNDILTDRE